MKARIKKTGEIIEVRHLCGETYIRNDCYSRERREYDEDELDLSYKETDKYWQGVRERAAIVAMQEIMNSFGSINYNRKTIAKLAIEQADALIKELKKK